MHVNFMFQGNLADEDGNPVERKFNSTQVFDTEDPEHDQMPWDSEGARELMALMADVSIRNALNKLPSSVPRYQLVSLEFMGTEIVPEEEVIGVGEQSRLQVTVPFPGTAVEGDDIEPTEAPTLNREPDPS